MSTRGPGPGGTSDGGGEEQAERRVARLALELDATAVGLAHRGHDRQAEASASAGPHARVVTTGETLEDVGLQGLRHTRTVVVDRHANPLPLRAHGRRDTGAVGGVRAG